MPKLIVLASVAIVAATLSAAAPATLVPGHAAGGLTILPANPEGVVGTDYPFTAWETVNGKQVNVTSSVRFGVTDGGACTGASCGSIYAGDHQVTAMYVTNGPGPVLFRTLKGSTTLTLAPGALASLQIFPSDATVEAPAPAYPNMDAADTSPYPSSQAYSALGFDAYGNPLGDETNAAFWNSLGGCTGNACRAETTGTVDVTAAVGAVIGISHITGATSGSYSYSCQGDNYDVDGNVANGCEQSESGVSHLPIAPIDLGSTTCDDTNTTTVTGTLDSDQRVHQNPAVANFDTNVGAAPDYWTITSNGGFSCVDDYSVELNTSGGAGASCYKLTITTDQTSNSITVNGSGGGSMSSNGASSYDAKTPVTFELQKTCSAASAHESVQFTFTFHL